MKRGKKQAKRESSTHIWQPNDLKTDSHVAPAGGTLLRAFFLTPIFDLFFFRLQRKNTSDCCLSRLLPTGRSHSKNFVGRTQRWQHLLQRISLRLLCGIPRTGNFMSRVSGNWTPAHQAALLCSKMAYHLLEPIRHMRNLFSR